jgi:hypothetical protein
MLTEEFFPSHSYYSNYRNGVERVKQDMDAGTAAGVVLIDDAVPVFESLKKFFLELRHKRPGLIITMRANEYVLRGFYDGRVQVYTGFGLAFAQAPDIVVGGIFIDQDEDNYGVHAPSIVNERYASHNRKHHMKKSKDFKKAMKVAAQHIKPRGFSGLRTEYEHEVLQNISAKIQAPALNTLRNALQISLPDMFDEMRQMIRMGYAPTTAKMREAMALVEAEGEALERTRKYSPRKVFVWLNTDKALYSIDGNEETAPQVAHTMDELPEDIRNKVAVLQISPVGSTIIDVGLKIDDTKYWVFV